LALNWLVPTSWLLSLPLAPRAVVAIIIAFLPITAANVIFARRFRATADAPLAFGTNLLGAMLGGALEYLSLVYGYHALLVVAAALYIAAYLVMPRSHPVVHSSSPPRGQPLPDPGDAAAVV
jgi:hypothetical protein